MNDLITIFEDRKVKLDLTKEQQQDILALKGSVWESQYLNLQVDGTLLMQHYVGFIARNKTRIQILPKIYNDGLAKGKEEASESMELLFKMLSYSGFIDIREIPEPQKIVKYNNYILEVFISIFIDRFLKLITSDVYRKYENMTDNMQFIKGKILFSESIKRNTFKNHVHYVEYEEFTVNTTLNRIFKTVILRLINETKSSENMKKLKLALVYLEDIDIIRLSKELLDSIRFNRLNLKYEPVFKLAKLFYYNYQPGFKEGDENTFTFLVPLNKLFEYFVYKVLSEHDFNFDGNVCHVEYQKPQQYLASLDNSGVFTLKPDITIMNKNKVLVIVDAKYKNPICDGEVSISQADVYQMLAYGVHYNCKFIYLVYPFFKGHKKESQLAEYKIKTVTGDFIIRVIQVDIMDENIDKIKDELYEIVRMN